MLLNLRANLKLTPRSYTKRKDYKAQRMCRLRTEVVRWMQEYETANTEKHRSVCMDMIQKNLKMYAWYKEKDGKKHAYSK